MKAFTALPISRKLTVILALTVTLALIVASVAFLAYDRLSVQQMIARRVHGQARTVAFNSASALVFDDPDSARRTLAGLQSDDHVVAARIHAPDGRLFAEYTRHDHEAGSLFRRQEMPVGVTEKIEDDELVVSLPIHFEGKNLGMLVLRSDLLEQGERSRTYVVIVTAVCLLALGVALTFGRTAQRSISQPILELAGAAHRIAEENDFRVRPVARSQDEVGKLVGAFNHMLDGLQRRDQELQATHAELERRIQEANEANRLKDEFLATLSHELRTPLNAIVGWAHMLRSGGLDAAAVDRALETISRSALTQSQIVADILDMQRIMAGKLRLTLKTIDIASVVQSAIDTVRPAATARKIDLQTSVDQGVATVLGDEDRLQQVMWNLLSNAVKFTPPGGRVRVDIVKGETEVAVIVEDTGPGLDPDFLPFAFDRFRQEDSSSTRRHGGLGLGLAIVRNLVELHGGSVVGGRAASGSGARFVVHLPRGGVGPEPGPPAVSGARTEAEAVPFEGATALHGIKVLVVDDQLDSRELLAAVLARCGADVTTVGSAAEAVLAMKSERPQVLLSDIEMPGEDGYSLIRAIRRLPAAEGGAIPAAALTAYAGAEDRSRALAAGFQVHVPKPVHPAELTALVLALTRRSSQA